jgi:tRNA threonylcarbamoyladenosine biosynthesis protein TsaB
MTRLLAVETSSEACSVALSIDGEARERHEHAPMRHAELLLPAISGLLDEAGMQVSDLDAIAFGRGPGSFTSLRIGIGVVQGLAWAADVPVVPCSSLAAMAHEAVSRVDAFNGRVCVAVDARMQEVFSAEFAALAGRPLQLLGAERVGAAGAVPGPSPDSWIAVGNGFARFPELTELAAGAVACLADLWPRASCIAELALDWLGEHEALPASLAQPVYVRNNVAEKPVPQ